MAVEGKQFKIVFEEGAFDDFEGTQEELDELIAEIKRMAESGELLEKGIPLEEMDDDVRELLESDADQRARRRLN